MRAVGKYTRPFALLFQIRKQRVSIADVVRQHTTIAVNLYAIVDLMPRARLSAWDFTG